MKRKVKVEEILLALIGVSSIAIAIIDFWDLDSVLPFLSGKISTLSLLVLGMIASYLVFERKSKLDKIETIVSDGFETTMFSLQGGPIKLFSDSGELYEYMTQRISNAQKSIDDLTWGDITSTVKTKQQDLAFTKYFNATRKTLNNKNIQYREVMSFPKEGKLRNERITRAEQMLNSNYFNYELGYYDFEHKGSPPLIQFLIIDNKEAIIAFYRARVLPLEGSLHFSTFHPLIVRFFRDYYDVIWSGSIILKRAGGEPNLNELDRVKNYENYKSMTNRFSKEDLEFTMSNLASNGWMFQQDENGFHYSFNHLRRIITFKYRNVQDLVNSIISDVFNDPEAYEIHFR